MRGREQQPFIRYGRESVYQAHVAFIREICEVHGYAASIIMRPISIIRDTTLFLRSASFNHIIPRLMALMALCHLRAYAMVSSLEDKATASYKAPPANQFLRRPRNALLDPPDDLTAELSFNGLTAGVLSAHRCYSEVPTRVVTSRDSLRRGDPSGSPVGESRANGICMSIGRIR
ncbi:hypothetical protein EVAR_28142_1 [Eumeta japonica]|uniref:Uncharacterized protein n=1 Tax=Eumeta variegata TaxID=151549 RepID=A0A4C1VD77_EUMVA|nr:hypothetical protein EVAR_28142_1 [Eumeta japonica]